MKNTVTYRPSSDALLDPCFDEVFKALFTHNSPESKNALLDFLSSLLEKDIQDLSLIPNEPPVDDDNDKQTRFDISCKFKDGKFADIEMQGRNENTSYEKRSEYLCARLLNYAVPCGMSWQDIPQVYQISLLGFNIDFKDENPISWCEMRKYSGRPLSNTMNIIFIELPKIRKMLRKHEDIAPENLPKVIKWCIFLCEAGNPQMQDYIDKLIRTEDGIMQAHTVLNKISTSDILWKKELDAEVVARDRASFIQAWTDMQNKFTATKKSLSAEEKKLSDTRQQLSDAEKKLSDTRQQLTDGEKKLSDTKQQLSDAGNKLSDTRQQLSDGEKKLSDTKQQLTDAEKKLSEIRDKQSIEIAKIMKSQ